MPNPLAVPGRIDPPNQELPFEVKGPGSREPGLVMVSCAYLNALLDVERAAIRYLPEQTVYRAAELRAALDKLEAIR